MGLPSIIFVALTRGDTGTIIDTSLLLWFMVDVDGGTTCGCCCWIVSPLICCWWWEAVDVTAAGGGGTTDGAGRVMTGLSCTGESVCAAGAD